MIDWLTAFKEIALKVADPSFVLGMLLVLTAAAQALMLMRRSRDMSDKNKKFDLTDVLIGSDGKVSRSAVIQMMFAEIVAWSYVLLAIQGKLSDTALVIALAIAVSGPAAIRLIDAIASSWAGRPAPVVHPPAPAVNVTVEAQQQ